MNRTTRAVRVSHGRRHGRPAAADEAPSREAQANRAGRREWFGLAVLAVPALLLAMDLSVLYLAIPRISANLRPSSAQLLWITDIYGFMLAGLLITMGALGDRIGRRRLLFIGAAGFGVASILAAYAATPAMLIAARAMLGIAGATLGPSTLALVGSMFRDQKQRSVAIAIWSTSLSVGGAAGPLVGGALLEHFWWGSVFLVSVPVMALLLVLGPFLLTEHREPGIGRIDALSVGLALASVLPVIYGLKELGQDGSIVGVVIPIVMGLVASVVFVRRQLHLKDPLLDLRLFCRPALTAALLANLIGFFLVLGITLLVDQQLQLVVGLSPLATGLAMVPMFVLFIAGALVSPLVVRYVHPPVAIMAGFLIAAAGLAVLLLAGSGEQGQWPLIVGLVIMAAGLAPVFPLVTNIVLASVPPERAGAASGLAETSTEFGGAMGIALLGIVGTIAYRSELVRTLPAPVPVPASLSAKGSLGAAVDVAAGLPHELGDSLLTAAQAAFTSGVHAAAVAGVITAVVVAVAVGTILRR